MAKNSKRTVDYRFNNVDNTSKIIDSKYRDYF